MNKVETFIKNFNPYQKQHIKQYHSEMLDSDIWVTKNKRLDYNIIYQGILEKTIAGYFITNSTIIIGLDIDDHNGNGDGYLLNIYQQIINKLVLKPSIIFKSPHGMHCYYFLNQFTPTSLIVNQTREALKGIPVEIRPTATQGIRIPAESKAINPSNMQLLNLPFETFIPECKKYHPAELFNNDILPGTIVQSLKEKRQTIKKLRAIPRIESIENKLLPFKKHNTNESFLKLCNVYRCQGLDENESFYRFKLCLMRSPLYTGDLRDDRRLTQRIKAEYKHNEGYTPTEPLQEQSLLAEIVTSNIVSKSPFAKQRNKPLQRFMRELLQWIDYQDEIFKNKDELAIWDYIYPYYRKNRKEGLYPIPKKLMIKWNQRYPNILKYLISIGLVEKSIYRYNPKYHICKYYKVNPDLFY